MDNDNANVASSLTTQPPVIFINPAVQLPLKLTPNNYPSWRAQVQSLLQGYNLLGYINGDIPEPTPTIIQEGFEVTNPDHAFWVQQDQLLLHAMFASISEPLMAYIASSSSSRDAWDKLTQMYANRSRSHILFLKERLSQATRGNKSVTEFLQSVKSLADQLALAGAPLQEEDLILHCLNGVGPEFKEIGGAIRAREQPISFEALHEKLIEYEDFLNRASLVNNFRPITINNSQKYNFNQYKIGRFQKQPDQNHIQQNLVFSPNPNLPKRFNLVCQFCGKRSHTARECFTVRRLMGLPIPPKTNFITTNHQNSQHKWFLNNSSSYRLISDIKRLSLRKTYDDHDDIFIRDGTGSHFEGTSSSRVEPK
ncbi:uncharacterized protein LOC110018626 [Phalaenopsis equestris]|uniref:uncharacterized protein LOC110018626 n=1 Tax=Phalaenopsis equestris TaxID=78828 RepID=UPI0009E2980C|nr:uncharacterized protein LOC110018626 [Phalaenopsis equestris]